MRVFLLLISFLLVGALKSPSKLNVYIFPSYNLYVHVKHMLLILQLLSNASMQYPDISIQ